MIEPYYFSAASLAALADENRERFRTARPFPHVVLDGFLPEALLDRVLEEFPGHDAAPWKSFKQATARKLASEGDTFFGDHTRQLLGEMNSATFLQFLESLTGMEGLIPDPYFFGGGLHQIEPGGFLKVHVDFSRHDTLHLDRCLNVIVYLNRDWDPSFHGALELWDAGMTEAVERVQPIFNRCVIFATEGANHGHPEPLACPPGRTRRSLAVFYYHSVDEARRELDDGSRYRERPGERIRSARILIKRCTPPILIDAVRALQRSAQTWRQRSSTPRR